MLLLLLVSDVTGVDLARASRLVDVEIRRVVLCDVVCGRRQGWERSGLELRWGHRGRLLRWLRLLSGRRIAAGGRSLLELSMLLLLLLLHIVRRRRHDRTGRLAFTLRLLL